MKSYQNYLKSLNIYVGFILKIHNPSLTSLSQLALLLEVFIQIDIEPNLCYSTDKLRFPDILMVLGDPLTKTTAR